MAANIHDHLERFSFTEDDSQETDADLALMVAAASTLPSLPQMYRDAQKLRKMASALMQNAFALTVFPPKVLISTRGSDQISFDMAIGTTEIAIPK